MTANLSKHKAGKVGTKDHDLSSVVSFVQQCLPQSEVRWKLHHASFLSGKKVFAFTRPDGVVLKLPENQIQSLIASRDAEFLVMGKRVMREWVLIRYPNHTECHRDRALFEQALQFVDSQ